MAFKHSAFKTLTAGVLAVTLAATSIAPTQASADVSRDDAIIGIATLLLLGAAIHNSRDNDRAETSRSQPEPPRPDWRVLPANCLRDVTRRNGDQVRIFGAQCLNSNYQAVHRLPNECRTTVRARNGQLRHGYGAQCLRHNGFRANRR